MARSFIFHIIRTVSLFVHFCYFFFHLIILLLHIAYTSHSGPIFPPMNLSLTLSRGKSRIIFQDISVMNVDFRSLLSSRSDQIVKDDLIVFLRYWLWYMILDHILQGHIMVLENYKSGRIFLVKYTPGLQWNASCPWSIKQTCFCSIFNLEYFSRFTKDPYKNGLVANVPDEWNRNEKSMQFFLQVVIHFRSSWSFFGW